MSLTIRSIPNRSMRRILAAQERHAARRPLRELAAGPFSTNSPNAALTVNQLLKQPTTISRDLSNIILQRGGFIADKLLVAGSPDEVAGGSMTIIRADDSGSYLNDSPESIAEDGDWPRTGWSETVRTELVKQYGLEVPITNLAIRRNKLSQVTQAERRLANQIVKFVDGKAITMLRTDPDIQSLPLPGGDDTWDNPDADIIGLLAEGEEMMDVIDEGLAANVLVVPKTMRANLIGNAALRDALKGIAGSETVRTGQLPNFLGLEAIYYTNSLPDDEALLVDTGVAGVIADEEPDPEEGWQAYDTGPGFKPIYVQVYQEKRPKRTVIAGGRWPGMGLVEPRAVVHLTDLK